MHEFFLAYVYHTSNGNKYIFTLFCLFQLKITLEMTTFYVNFIKFVS